MLESYAQIQSKISKLLGVTQSEEGNEGIYNVLFCFVSQWTFKGTGNTTQSPDKTAYFGQ